MEDLHAPDWTAAFDEALREPRFRARLLECARWKGRWAWRYRSIDDYAEELVQDALLRTLDGRRPWDGCGSLLHHLFGVIRSRSEHDYRHAKRFRQVELVGDVHEAPPEYSSELDDRADEVFAMMFRLAHRDPQVLLLLDAYAEGFLLRAEVLARTGLTDHQYEAARDRLARLRDKLPHRLAR